MAGSNIIHAAGMRIRVWGNGDLNSAFAGFQNIQTQQLVPVALVPQASSSRKVDRLGNFVSQSIKWRLGQPGVVGDFARVNDVTVYIKQIWTQFPG